ncbi:quinone oxidoreductase [Variovorax sp. WS11]|uniref:quinone oxidoreductase family protein n=1 Tax=Variovorax sp. WS11 TaxID=1105204 RepID=UPI000D0D3922|nr:zinc-binding dehydrogenase [Variovorax sp. WS11]NDZ18146.1 zinc-binding dehydrogenase [Variovorax sp. WS11]PSL79761.1 quinone oxidoreductase [Variovorax sp. WS11]
MKAIISTAEGARLADVPVPQPKPNEILVRVKAASLNRADLAGLAAKNDSVIGMEWAGEVVEAGPEAGDWKPGDRVMCTGAGAYAEYAVTDGGRACRIPDAALPYEEASILTLALQAMHDAIVTHGQLQRGQDVLIHGASSGVGLMGLQIARLLGAGRVIGTSTSAERRARLAEFGADLALDPGEPEWHQRVLEATGGKGVEVIVDQVTGQHFSQTMQTAAIGGRIVNLGRLGGAGGEFDFQLHALRRISYIGVTFRTRSSAEIRTLNAKMLADLGNAIGERRLRLPIDSRFALAEAGGALARMAANRHFGKIVLTV